MGIINAHRQCTPSIHVINPHHQPTSISPISTPIIAFDSKSPPYHLLVVLPEKGVKYDAEFTWRLNCDRFANPAEANCGLEVWRLGGLVLEACGWNPIIVAFAKCCQVWIIVNPQGVRCRQFFMENKEH